MADFTVLMFCLFLPAAAHCAGHAAALEGRPVRGHQRLGRGPLHPQVRHQEV